MFLTSFFLYLSLLMPFLFSFCSSSPTVSPHILLLHLLFVPSLDPAFEFLTVLFFSPPLHILPLGPSCSFSRFSIMVFILFLPLLLIIFLLLFFLLPSYLCSFSCSSFVFLPMFLFLYFFPSQSPISSFSNSFYSLLVFFSVRFPFFQLSPPRHPRLTG